MLNLNPIRELAHARTQAQSKATFFGETVVIVRSDDGYHLHFERSNSYFPSAIVEKVSP